MAAAQALNGDLTGAHEHLKRAIEIEPRNRLHARQDTDFAHLSHQAPFEALLYPEKEELVVAASPLHVVAIGGGTGLSCLLQGLKRYAWTRRSGYHRHCYGDRRRRKLRPPAPPVRRAAAGRYPQLHGGAERRFGAAVAPVSISFRDGRGLKGHSFGNLFLMALTQIMGDFPDAVKASSEVLKIAGRIFPATAANVALEATLANGTNVIGRNAHQPQPATDSVDPAASAEGEAASGNSGGDRGCGRNHARAGIVVHQRDSRTCWWTEFRRRMPPSPAVKAYFVNLMSQPGETTEFSASDHIRALHKHAGGQFLDYAVINIRPITWAMKKAHYAKQRALPVDNDIDATLQTGGEGDGGETGAARRER